MAEAALIAVFRGPAHVLVAVNEHWRSRDLEAPPIGVPVREAWPDEAWAATQAIMDEVFASGIADARWIAGGKITVAPYRHPSGDVAGVMTHFRPDAPVPLRLRPRREDLLRVG